MFGKSLRIALLAVQLFPIQWSKYGLAFALLPFIPVLFQLLQEGPVNITENIEVKVLAFMGSRSSWEVKKKKALLNPTAIKGSKRKVITRICFVHVKTSRWRKFKNSHLGSVQLLIKRMKTVEQQLIWIILLLLWLAGWIGEIKYRISFMFISKLC